MKSKSCLSIVTLSLIALFLMCGPPAFAQDPVAAQPATSAVPNLLRYGGVLKDANGALLASQTVGITFALYKQQDGGVALWTETRNVTTDAAGQYNVMLGSTKSEGVPADLFSDQEQRWLAVQVQGQPEPSRVLLVSVPYAFKAHEAETLGGLPASAFVKAATVDGAAGTSTDSGTSVNALSSAGKAGSTAKGQVQPPTVSDCLTPQLGAITMWSRNIQVTPPIWEICNSNLFQLPNGWIGIGTTHPSKELDVMGTINARHWYDIGVDERRIVSVHTQAIPVIAPANSTNLFLGWEAAGPDTNTQSNGSFNTFTGHQSGYKQGLTVPTPGYANTYNGYYSGWSNRSGNANTMVGALAGRDNVDAYNTCVGASACQNHKNGGGGTYVGNVAGAGDVTGITNSFFGDSTGYFNVGNYNTFIGQAAGEGNVGDFNTFLGQAAGSGNHGNSNTFSGYQSGLVNSAGNNVFYGYQAGFSNTVGTRNTFLGYQAGLNNTTGGTSDPIQGNTFVGWSAGLSNVNQGGDTFVGNGAGLYVNGNTYGGGNTFVGDGAGTGTPGLATGDENSFLGYFSGSVNTSGSENAFFGDSAGLTNTTGSGNTFVGSKAGWISNTTGSWNIYLGAYAGFIAANASSSNIYVGNFGGNESNVIRIGDPDPVNIAHQTDAYIAGIYGANAGTGGSFQSVCVDSKGKLWGVSALANCIMSSRRFKDEIADMGDGTSKLLQLRPVSFFYKPQYDDGSHLQQYGLIAEEVAQVYPEMAVYDKDGKPYSVKYQLLAPMLLNEFQKQHRSAEAQGEVIKAQQQEIEGLKAQLQLQNAAFQERLSRLESLVTTQMQTAAAKPPQATTPANGGMQ